MPSATRPGIDQLEEHRPALVGRCHRMLGSIVDADDAVQETMVRAWRAVGRFEGRASLKTWLHRIATNVCLDVLANRARQLPTVELAPASDARARATDPDPETLAMRRQGIRLAFVAALLHLPPRQRAVLLLREVLGWSAAEIKEALGLSVAAVNSALQRARATLATRDLRARRPLSERQRRLLRRYLDAFERHDVDQLAAISFLDTRPRVLRPLQPLTMLRMLPAGSLNQATSTPPVTWTSPSRRVFGKS